MEALYTALQDEIQAFKVCIRSCQQAFDIHTLYNVLQLLLPVNGDLEHIQSLEQLEKLAESKEWDGQDIVRVTFGQKKCEIPNYISWFVSYVRYLGSLKETFDTKVVFPLCENLYVNDGPLGTLLFRGRERHSPHVTASVAHLAKQLFAIRRKWALLLKGGTMDEHAFSPQSLLDLQGFANLHPFVKIMRLIPDLFHKSLATAELARQWVQLHASRHHAQQVQAVATRRCKDMELATGSLEHLWYSKAHFQPRLPEGQHGHLRVSPQFKNSSSSSSNEEELCMRTGSQEKNKLSEIHGELMSLLWREERCWTLEVEIQEINQRVYKLQLQCKDKERELEAIQHSLENDNWNMPVTHPHTVVQELHALERKLRLEEYHKNILQGDWLLELEVRPTLLRQINTVRD